MSKTELKAQKLENNSIIVQIKTDRKRLNAQKSLGFQKKLIISERLLMRQKMYLKMLCKITELYTENHFL